MNLLNIIVSIATLLSIIIGAGWAILLFRKREKLEKAQLYKDLEFKAIDLFLEASRRPELNKIYDPNGDLPNASQDYAGFQKWQIENKSLFDYAYCILTLFELIFNLQKRHLITEEIFLTWVAWYWDFSRGKFTKWLFKEASCNYSSDFVCVMNKFFSLSSENQQEVYAYLESKKMIRFDIKEWLASHSSIR